MFAVFLECDFCLQGLEKEETERRPRLDELNQTGQTLVEQMGKGKALDFIFHVV